MAEDEIRASWAETKTNIQVPRLLGQRGEATID